MRIYVCVASTLWFLIALASSGQAPPVPRPTQRADTVKNAEAAVGKAAVERKILLTEEAKRTLALEVVRQETASAKPTTSEPSTAAVERVLAPVADRGATTVISAEAAQTAVLNDKTRQVTATLAPDVTVELAATKTSITDAARQRLLVDLEAQTEGLPRSGLDIVTMRSRNQAFIKAIDSMVTEVTITEPMYQQARNAVFQRLVKVTLETTPAGAVVAMGGGRIGTTPIVSKPFESGKSYRFEFLLSGYRPTTREFYVTAVPEAQTIAELLAPDAASSTPLSPPAETSQSPSNVEGPWRSYILVGTGGLLLLFVVILLARKRT